MAKGKLISTIGSLRQKLGSLDNRIYPFEKQIITQKPIQGKAKTSKQKEWRAIYRYYLIQYQQLDKDTKEIYKQLGKPFNLPAYQMFMKIMLNSYANRNILTSNLLANYSIYEEVTLGNLQATIASNISIPSTVVIMESVSVSLTITEAKQLQASINSNVSFI